MSADRKRAVGLYRKIVSDVRFKSVQLHLARLLSCRLEGVRQDPVVVAALYEQILSARAAEASELSYPWASIIFGLRNVSHLACIVFVREVQHESPGQPRDQEDTANYREPLGDRRFISSRI